MTQGQPEGADRGASRRTARTSRQPTVPAAPGRPRELEQAMEIGKRHNAALSGITKKARELQQRVELLEKQVTAAEQAQQKADAEAAAFEQRVLSLLESPELLEAEKYLGSGS